MIVFVELTDAYTGQPGLYNLAAIFHVYRVTDADDGVEYTAIDYALGEPGTNWDRVRETPAEFMAMANKAQWSMEYDFELARLQARPIRG